MIHKMLNIRFYFGERKWGSVFIISLAFREGEDSSLVLRVGGKECRAECLAAGGVSGDEGNMSGSFDQMPVFRVVDMSPFCAVVAGGGQALIDQKTFVGIDSGLCRVFHAYIPSFLARQVSERAYRAVSKIEQSIRHSFVKKKGSDIVESPAFCVSAEIHNQVGMMPGKGGVFCIQREFMRVGLASVGRLYGDIEIAFRFLVPVKAV